MKIINRTKWDTLDLKKILTKALHEEEKIEGRLSNKGYLEVEIISAGKWNKKFIEYFKSKNRDIPEVRKAYSGYAYINGDYMKLRLPDTNIDTDKLAKLFIHELKHIRGFRHKDMISYIEYNTNWAKDYIINLKAKIKKPKEDLQIKRYKHVLEMYTKKVNQLKRLKNQIKKWESKKKYYEKVLANGNIKGGK